ncbi:Alkaline phosphatase synthesis sensor protein PhoR [Clostridium ljungdahlii DSM 13528]|uniref:histidine kinase n=2 Tax=Clostridium TaxID=1485 RepID=A0ABX2TVE4_CLOLD|nr:Integral membrane sensor signal transduction histidine kinase [Clostridium autoethanogenum DSM 10061]OAA87669.1 Alkaline phosphatase synthesis sensor protein PhoR [Clostridium ljungdahlii DSM 13528]OVY51171.1 Alkaline phosphatase synthesis sensor protein PhoR [Clostridium autoethanogenum]
MVLDIKGLTNYLKMGIKFKLISFTASLLLIVISFLSFLVLNGIKSYQNKETQAILFKQKDIFEEYFSERMSLNKNTDYDDSLARGSIFNKAWLRTIPANIYNTKGELLSGFKTDAKLNENDEKKIMIDYAIKGKVSYREINDVIYFYSPIKYKGSTAAILELEYSIRENKLFYSDIEKLFYGIGFLALVLGIFVGIFYFSRLTRDIYEMKDSVESIQKSEFSKVHKVNRNDELGELSSGLIFMSNTIKQNIEELQVERDSLSRAVDKLKKMDKQQKEFIGNVTHEFKTPITSIKAYADVIGMYTDDLKLIEEGTLSISKECDRLSSMVDNILSLSALEKYDFEIEKNEVNLKKVLNEICKTMMAKVKKNSLILKYDAEDIVVTLDEDSLKHILINLIDNAIKYNRPGGSIYIECYKNDKDKITISVKDTGIGMSEEVLPQIFEPFYRADKHRSRETGGAGLGLALVKKLVEKQEGNIKVNSKLNEGTTFYVEFST